MCDIFFSEIQPNICTVNNEIGKIKSETGKICFFLLKTMKFDYMEFLSRYIEKKS